MTKYEPENIKQEVRDYLVENKDFLTHLASDIVKDYDVRRVLFINFIPDFESERNAKIRSVLMDELTRKFGTSIELVEEVLGDVDVYKYLFGEKELCWK